MQTEANLECNPQRVTPSTEIMFRSGMASSGLPMRGLIGSLLAHLLFAWLGFYLPWSYWLPSTARLVTTESTLRQQEVLLLPDLHPANDSGSSNSQGSRTGNLPPVSSPGATTAKGVMYKGEQLIVSNPPHPDNFVQTIRQPDLISPPKLPRPLPFPAMILMAPAISLPVPAMPQLPTIADRHIQPPHPADVLTVRPPERLPQVDSPKLPLPVLQTGLTPLPEIRVARISPPSPASQRATAPGAGGSDTKNILIADAVEVPARTVLSIPPGELYGSFTVTPGPLPAATGKSSPGAMGGNASSGSGSGSGTGTGAEEGSGNKPGVAGDGTGHGEGGGAKLAGNGHGSGGSTGTGSGHGSGSGGSGGGRGNGIGNGNSPFPDIVIQGGSGRTTQKAAPAPTGSSPRQSSYGITIVANGASGGGFKDFGVFHNEASYTVYLDMSDAGASGPDWTLQYALDSRPASGIMPLHSRSLLVPPYAATKMLPRFSAEVAIRNRGSVIVVFGLINSKGNFEGLRVLQSPDASFNKLLLEALAQWVFRPAEVEGTPVPVKVLLGIPITSVPLKDTATPTGRP